VTAGLTTRLRVVADLVERYGLPGSVTFHGGDAETHVTVAVDGEAALKAWLYALGLPITSHDHDGWRAHVVAHPYDAAPVRIAVQWSEQNSPVPAGAS
jgi:hypothetical protein